MNISFKALCYIQEHETAKVYGKEVSRAAICLCLLICLVLLFGEKTKGRRIRDGSSASDSLWADSGLEACTQSADGIEGIQTEAAWLQGAGMVLTDRRTNKWTTSVRSGPSPGLPSGCRAAQHPPAPHGKNSSSAPSRLIGSD